MEGFGNDTEPVRCIPQWHHVPDLASTTSLRTPSGRIVRTHRLELDRELDLVADPRREGLELELRSLELALRGKAVDRVFSRYVLAALVVGHAHRDRLRHPVHREISGHPSDVVAGLLDLRALERDGPEFPDIQLGFRT